MLCRIYTQRGYIGLILSEAKVKDGTEVIGVVASWRGTQKKIITHPRFYIVNSSRICLSRFNHAGIVIWEGDIPGPQLLEVLNSSEVSEIIIEYIEENKIKEMLLI